MARKRRPKTLPEPKTTTPAPLMKPPADDPPEVHCKYAVIHGESWTDLETQVNIECTERGAIPTGGPSVTFGTGENAPYSQAVIYPVEQ